LQVVMHHHDRPPFVAQSAQDVDDLAFAARIHPLERLVQNEQIRLLDQGAGQKHSLLLAARELADLPRGEVRHAHHLHRAACLEAFGTPGPPEPAEFTVSAHQHDIFDGGREVGIDPATINFYDNVDALLADLAVDALSICTPPQLHAAGDFRLREPASTF